MARNAVINFALATDNVLIAAPGAGIKLVVFSLILVADAHVGATIKTGTTAKTGVMDLAPAAVRESLVFPFNPEGWFAPALNEALVLTLDGAVQVSGCVSYGLIRNDRRID